MTKKNAFPQTISSPGQNVFCLAGVAYLLHTKGERFAIVIVDSQIIS